MRPSTPTVLITLIATLLVSVQQEATAHHSTAEFDYTRDLTIEGVVKEVQWTNPHAFLQVLVSTDGATQEEWAIEIGSPALNARRGWSKDSVKPGDQVRLQIAPARNGNTYGTLRILTLDDGREFAGAAANITSSSPGSALSQ